MNTKLKTLIFSLFTMIYYFNFVVSYSAGFDGGGGGGGGSTSGSGVYSFGSLQQSIMNIFNAFIGVVAAVLIVMIAYGVWKSSMATGDPRGLEGAKQTWIYALYGFFVVVLFGVIFSIIAGWFGAPVLTPAALLSNVFAALESLISVPSNNMH